VSSETPATTKIRGCVVPHHIYQPEQVQMVAFPRTWAFQCGECDKDVVQFSFTGKPRCPFCRTVNLPEYLEGMY
jgi:hypothetical protein